MIQEKFARDVFRKLDSFGLSSLDKNDEFKFNDTLKPFILESIEAYPPIIESNNTIKIEVRNDEFILALLSDFYFGLIRIVEQKNNVNALLDCNAQTSWIVTTAYYACYFMAVELSKLNGQFIINFSKMDFEKILLHSKNKNNIFFPAESNNSFKVTVSHSGYPDFLNLIMTKEASKPHQIVWINLHRIIKQVTVDDSIQKYKELVLNICDANNDKWRFPSDIRNEWNYARADYYGSKGNDLGKTFISIIKKYQSTIRWAGNITIQPTDENIVASIAYLYHVLSKVIEIINNRLNIVLINNQ